MKQLQIFLTLCLISFFSCVLITEENSRYVGPYAYCKIDGVEKNCYFGNFDAQHTQYRQYPKREISIFFKPSMLIAGEGEILEDSTIWVTRNEKNQFYYSFGKPGSYYITKIDSNTNDTTGHFDFWASCGSDSIHVTDGTFLIPKY